MLNNNSWSLMLTILLYSVQSFDWPIANSYICSDTNCFIFALVVFVVFFNMLEDGPLPNVHTFYSNHFAFLRVTLYLLSKQKHLLNIGSFWVEASLSSAVRCTAQLSSALWGSSFFFFLCQSLNNIGLKSAKIS